MRFYFTGTEAARFLRMDYRTWQKLVDRGEIQAFGYLVTESDQRPIYEYAAVTALQSRNTESDEE